MSCYQSLQNIIRLPLLERYAMDVVLTLTNVGIKVHSQPSNGRSLRSRDPVPDFVKIVFAEMFLLCKLDGIGHMPNSWKLNQLSSEQLFRRHIDTNRHVWMNHLSMAHPFLRLLLFSFICFPLIKCFGNPM